MAKFLVSVEKAPQLGCGGLLVIGLIVFVIAKSGSSSSSAREDEIVRNTPQLFPPTRTTDLASSGNPARATPNVPVPTPPPPAPLTAPTTAEVVPRLSPPPAATAPPNPPARPQKASRATPVAAPPGGCELDGITYEADGSIWACGGGGNWCSTAPRLPGGCPKVKRPTCPDGAVELDEIERQGKSCPRACWTDGHCCARGCAVE